MNPHPRSTSSTPPFEALSSDADSSQDESSQGTHPEVLAANRAAYDRMARAGKPLCQPATDEDLAQPLQHVDPLGWLGPSIRGWRVLCLAAGGGRHSALYATAGADVTVLDLSPVMLELDRRVAEERGLNIRVLEGSMEHLSMLPRGGFDLVIHPVSTCYVPDIAKVFREVAYVLTDGGLYVSQHKQPTSLQSSIQPSSDGGYRLMHRYYRSDPVPPPTTWDSVAGRLREQGTYEYLHRWEEIVGGMCRAGFVIEDLVEPMHAKASSGEDAFAQRARYVAPYVRIKARRRGSGAAQSGQSLWVPD